MIKSKGVKSALAAQDKRELWLAVEEWLIDENWPAEAIKEIEKTLTAQGLLRSAELYSDHDVRSISAYLGVPTEELDSTDAWIGAGSVKPNGTHRS